MRPRTILVPLDGSSRSSQVLELIRNLYNPHEDQLYLLRVAPVPPGMALVPHGAAAHQGANLLYHESLQPEELPAIYASQIMESKRDELLSELRLEARALKQAGFVVTSQVRFGEPVEEILAASEAHQVDLIAMATHGRSGIRRMLMGSVAEAVLRRSTVPVLMLRSVPSLVKGDSKLAEPAGVNK